MAPNFADRCISVPWQLNGWLELGMEITPNRDERIKTILVVEDDAAIRYILRVVLERMNHMSAQRPNASPTPEFLAAVVECSDDAIITKDLNGVVMSRNSSAERIFGYTAEEMIGQPISILATPDRIDEMPMILGRIRNGEGIAHYQTIRQTKDRRLLNI